MSISGSSSINTQTIINTPIPDNNSVADVKDSVVSRGYDNNSSQLHLTELPEVEVGAKHRLSMPSVQQTPEKALATLNKLSGMSVTADDIANANSEFSPQSKAVKEKLVFSQTIHSAEQISEKPLNSDQLAQAAKITSVLSADKKTDGAIEVENKANITWSDIRQSVEQKTPEDRAYIDQAEAAHNLTFKENGIMDTMAKASAIVDGPPELIASIRSDSQRLQKIMFNSNDLWDVDEITFIVAQLQDKMQSNRLKFDQQNINASKEQKEVLSKHALDDMKESIEKGKKRKAGDVAKKVFSYIGMALMAIATVFAFITGVGAAAGACMIAAMAITVTMQVDQETGGHMMNGMVEGMVDAFNIEENVASAIVNSIIMAVVIALSIGGAAAGASAGKAAGAVEKITKAQEVVAKLTQVTSIISGVNSIAEGVAGIPIASYTYEAEMLKASSLEYKGDSERVNKRIADAIQSMKVVLEKLEETQASIASMINDNSKTKIKLAKKMG